MKDSRYKLHGISADMDGLHEARRLLRKDALAY
jgi:hypothetical protein